MLVLAVDTALEMTSVAISEKEEILAETAMKQSQTQGESLFPTIDALLKQAGKTIDDVDLYAVGIGPGSFTGLRIGITALKMLAQVTNKPIVGISTLEAMAFESCEDMMTIPILDARGNRVYAGWYHVPEVLKEADELYEMEELIPKLEKIHEPFVLLGNGITKMKDALEKMPNAHIIREENTGVGASIAILGYQKYIKNQSGDQEVFPNYIRKSQAERDLEKKGIVIDAN